MDLSVYRSAVADLPGSLFVVPDPNWYDSVWLRAYLTAKEVIARAAPRRLDEFVRAFDVLRTRPDFAAQHMPGAIDPPLLAELRQIVKDIPQEKYEFQEIKVFGRFMVHDLPEFTALQHKLVDQVSEWAGEPVEPCYNFLSLYTRMGVCRPHLDSPEAKWTLDLCLDQSGPWPIHFSKIVPWLEERADVAAYAGEAIREQAELEFRSVAMEPGDAILFSGSSQWHYRDPLPRDGGKHFCDLLFLHYIPSGSGELIKPKNWAAMFGIPELDEIPGLAEIA